MTNLYKERKQFWKDVYLAYAASSNAVATDGAYKWADKALERFDERFKKSPQKN